MTDHAERVRADLGQLGVMAAQNEEMERRILMLAEDRLEDVNQKLPELQARARSGDDASSADYMEAIEERGRLQLVISKARAALA